MADLNDHCRSLLGTILATSPRDSDRASELLSLLQQRVDPDQFTDASLGNMYRMLVRYSDITGQVLTEPALDDMMRASSADPGKKAMYTELYRALADRTPDIAGFAWSIEQLLDLTGERKWGEALSQGMEILRSGATDTDGKTHRGWKDSRDHVLEVVSEIDRQVLAQESPEGDMTREQDAMLQDYAAARKLKLEGRASGVNFGIPELDTKIGGFQNGELNILAGYSSDGKTSLSVQLAWSAAVEQGKNVLIMTTETLRPQVRRKLLSRHSRHPSFELPEGINSRWLKEGTIPEAHTDQFYEVVRDFTKNPHYGRLYIKQVPRGATLETCERMAYRIQRKFNIDLVIIDYLRLLRSSLMGRRNSDREELGAILVESKQFATTFDNGRGVPVFSPWQVNRTSWDEAQTKGFYTSKALSETAEATNTPDVICSILAPPDNEDRYCEVKAQILKNRDGEKANSVPLRVDYATSTFQGLQRTSGLEPATGELGESDDLSSLLDIGD